MKSTRTEVIRDVRNPSLRGRITTTEYFERPELLQSAVDSLEEAQETVRTASEGGIIPLPTPALPASKTRKEKK